MPTNDARAEAHALAALSLCEALLVALVDLKIVPGLEAKGILKDAVAAHREAAEVGGNETSKAAAAIIRAMLARNASAWVNPKSQRT